MITTLLRPEAATPAPDADFWYGPVGQPTASGVRVDSDRALRLNAYLACVRVIAETMASLPWILYRERANGGKDRATDHPMYPKFKTQPNQWQTRFEFVEMMQGHASCRGNAFAEIVPTGGGAAELVPFNPDRMMVEQLENGRLRYVYRNETGGDEVYSQGQIFHLRGFSKDGIAGIDPVDVQSDTIGTAIAVNLYRGRFFANDATPGGILSHPGKLSPTAKNNIESSFSTTMGTNQHRWRVLEEDMKAMSIASNAEESQLAEILELDQKEIARMHRVPPHMIGILDDATFSNIEHQAIDFVVHTIRPWCVRWEQAAQRDIVDDESLFTEFLVDGLLRGDVESRYQAYSIGIANRFLSPDEVREKENMNPRPDGEGGVFENPNTTPGQPEPPENRETEDNDEDSAQWADVFVADCVNRISGAEIRTVQKHMKHANSDRERFIEWAKDFYGGHSEFILKTLSPLCVALGTAGKTFDIEAVTSKHVDAECEVVAASDAEGFSKWASGLPGRLKARITEAIQ